MPDPLLPKISVGDMDDDQRATYEAITGGRRASGPGGRFLTDQEGRLDGPFNSMLYGAKVGHALQAVGSALRFESSLAGRCREVAILEVARLWESAYERLVHEEVAIAAGLSEQEVACISSGDACVTLSEGEEIARSVASSLVSAGDLDEVLLERALATLGHVGTNELTVLVGYYQLLALLLRVWRVPLAQGHSNC